MTSQEVRKRFLKLLEEYGHAVIPSASVVPENDPSVLFTTAGMQPLVPYLLGEKHPKGTRLTNVQKCIRTQDIDEIGDKTHNTFFEMVGYWSLGDYFKEQAITQTYTFITSRDKGLGLDPDRIYVTCFEGNDDAPRDEESAEIWKKLGVPEHRIYYKGADDNWWSPGDNGPCGPDSELFYDITSDGLGDLTPEEFNEADDKQQIIELANTVFMEYEKKDGVVVGKLQQQNVDMGGGFERMVAVVQGKDNVFETDLFMPILEVIRQKATKTDTKKERIIADHIRTSVMMISDGVLPSNSDQGYILRRLLRRSIRTADALGMPEQTLSSLVDAVASIYNGVYSTITDATDRIQQVIADEETKFRKTLADGLKQFTKLTEDGSLSGDDAFKLFATYGFPFEVTKELADEQGVAVDEAGYHQAFAEHQEASRTASAGKFKGGLAGSGEMETKYHTATHLLHAALRAVLGDHVMQKGSNITAERLRFDFSHDEKLTDEEKEQVTEWVNNAIQADYPVTRSEMPFDEAKQLGAIGLFEDKYGDTVSVYTVGGADMVVSRELCGGPHVERTGALGTFRIKKEEASSAGVRRIKAVLE